MLIFAHLAQPAAIRIKLKSSYGVDLYIAYFSWAHQWICVEGFSFSFPTQTSLYPAYIYILLDLKQTHTQKGSVLKDGSPAVFAGKILFKLFILMITF